MWDICDGNSMKNDPLFSSDSKALQIILNCDDMEVVNPLGSHIIKHKLSMFYYSLGNIPPEYRSKTDSIQLLAIGKTRDVRDEGGSSKLLADFCRTIAKLSSVGIDMNLFGHTYKMKGNLVIVCADTLAANWLGKFKGGVSFALRNCRRCEIENTHVSHRFVEREIVLRTLQEHCTRCQELSTLTASARQYWSRIWGYQWHKYFA